MGCRDPEDDPFIETAIKGGAEYLVTRDKRLLHLPLHVNAYVKARGVTILRDVRPDGFFHDSTLYASIQMIPTSV